MASLLIFGATLSIGAHVLRQAPAAGRQVIALLSSPVHLYRRRAGLALVAAIALLVLAPAQSAVPVSCPVEGCLSRVSATIPISANSELFERLGDAAENGNVEAMNLLGALFVSNARTPSDYSMALYWFQRAADGGSAEAMYNVGSMYLRGVGGPRDYPNALRWFRRAAERGNPLGMYSVAVMLEHGLGSARDAALARDLYRKAAEAGVPLAMIWLSEDLDSHGKGKNLVEACAWLEVAALAELDGQLHILVVARMEDLGSRLGAEGREQARSKAARLVADIRARAIRETPSRQPASPAARIGPSV